MSRVRRASGELPAKHLRCISKECPRNGGTCGGMEGELSMTSRAEVTTKYAKAYVRASKKDK
ncbi:MAG: hypothetical protein WA991_06465, partial [Ornithinimicrobium sp.]